MTKSAMHSEVDIEIGLTQNERSAVASGLSNVLADTFTLYLQTHNFHWNVEGPMFNPLHAMLMEQYTELWNALDAIAERIRALGVPAPATFSQFYELASIKEASGVPSAIDMVRHLVKAHQQAAITVRATHRVATAAHDEPTVDLLTQRLQSHEKVAWMLRSLLK